MDSKHSSNTFDVRSAAMFITAVGLIILSVGVFFVGNVIYRNNIVDRCKLISAEEVQEMQGLQKFVSERDMKDGTEVCKPEIKLKSTLPFSIGGPIAFVGLALLAGTKKSKVHAGTSENT
jgi:hypothetical protein